MEINQTEKTLKALANRRRLKIIKYIFKNKKASVSELSEYLNLSLKSTSKHLLILKNVEILDSEQIRLTRFYALVYPLSPLVKEIVSMV